MEVVWIVLVIFGFIFGMSFVVSLAQLFASLVGMGIDFVDGLIKKIRGNESSEEVPAQSEPQHQMQEHIEQSSEKDVANVEENENVN